VPTGFVGHRPRPIPETAIAAMLPVIELFYKFRSHEDSLKNSAPHRPIPNSAAHHTDGDTHGPRTAPSSRLSYA